MPKQPSNKQPSVPIVRTSIRRKASSQMFFVTALTAASLSLCAFVLAQSLMQRQILNQLSSIARHRAYMLEQRFLQDKENIRLFGVQSIAKDILQGKGSVLTLKQKADALTKQHVPILDIAIFDTEGSNHATLAGTIQSPLASLPENTAQPDRDYETYMTYILHVPIYDDGTMLGTMCVRYSLEDFITVLYSAPGMGQTEQVLLGSLSNDEIIVITENHVSGKFTFLETGDFRQALKANMPMAGALTQSNGTTIGYDYTGHRVLAAYVGIPELQWGLVAKIHYEEAMRDVFILSLILVMISVLLIVLAGYLAYIFARSLTNPIISLSKTMSALGPSTNWTMKKSLATGDEVEVLENVAADMAMRLKCVYEDMEEEIEARTEELRQQYRKDSAILKSIDYGVVMTDANGIITEANPAARDYIQNAKQEYQGKHIADTVIIQSGKQGQGGVHPVIETLKTKQSIRSTPDVHFSIVRSDNLLIPVTLSCVPLMSGATVVGAILVFQDATEQRRVDYLKSEFISLASHQLRTPLSSMQWYIELFGDEKGMSKIQKEYLAEMRTAAKRMTSLIDALLHSARLETQDITPQVAPVDAVALLEDLCSEFRTMGRKKHITCNITLPKKKVIIETDSVLLHVAFKNLFSNAIKYTPENGKVSVSMRDTARAIEVVVTDTGIGIPKKEQKRIFERLFRASNARKMDTDGNGLGLYITKMIVESFGGTLRITSTEKKGTTVTLTLPKTMKKQKE